ncbi:MAG: tryptophan--tRNA ligase [Firmicutes bacterium]|nr:tryptophan--tRNA ligase [Bacillota bacterium]
MKERILTGIKPTGIPHIGNYFGAIKPAIDMSKNENYDCLYFIADYHALNIIKNKEDFEKYTYIIAATWLACGLDPNKVIFYKQSDLPEVFELNWILSNVTAKGLLNRAHAYKACVEKNLETGNDPDYGINMGLYNYPVLMAADILLMNSNKVPVGQDQKQHLEIARDIAIAFNNIYGKCFVLPQDLISETLGTLPGLDGRKMSKSYGNTITLFDDENTLKKQINRIVTDSKMPGEPKDTNCTLFQIYSLFASDEQKAEMKEKFENGIGWGEAKKQTFELINSYISPMREKYNYYMSNTQLIDQILQDGAKKARAIASDTLARVRKLIGKK